MCNQLCNWHGQKLQTEVAWHYIIASGHAELVNVCIVSALMTVSFLLLSNWVLATVSGDHVELLALVVASRAGLQLGLWIQCSLLHNEISWDSFTGLHEYRMDEEMTGMQWPGVRVKISVCECKEDFVQTLLTVWRANRRPLISFVHNCNIIVLSDV